MPFGGLYQELAKLDLVKFSKPTPTSFPGSLYSDSLVLREDDREPGNEDLPTHDDVILPLKIGNS